MRGFLRRTSSGSSSPSNNSSRGGGSSLGAKSMSNRSLNNDSPHALCRLMVRQDWAMIREILSTELVVRNTSSGSDDEASGRNILSVACRHNPPADAVKLLIKTFPDAISYIDDLGRTPLHIASTYAASPEVFHVLVEEHPVAASSPDDDGKTPLHHVCEHYLRRFKQRKSPTGVAGAASTREVLLDVVKTLCKSAPTVVNLEDEAGMSALEYAIDAGMDLKVVRSIQKACEKDWKKRKTGGLRHAVMEKSLQEQFDRRTRLPSESITEITLSLDSMGVSGGQLSERHSKKSPMRALTA